MSRLGYSIPDGVVWYLLAPAVLLLAAYSIFGPFIDRFAKYTFNRIGFRRSVYASLALVLCLALAVQQLFYNKIISIDEFQVQTTELSAYNNIQLRSKAIQTAKELRKCGRDLDRIARDDDFLLHEGETFEQQRQRHLEKSKVMERNRDEFKFEFYQKFGTDLFVLRKELRIRLKAAGKLRTDREFGQGNMSIAASEKLIDQKYIGNSFLFEEVADMFENMGKELP